VDVTDRGLLRHLRAVEAVSRSELALAIAVEDAHHPVSGATGHQIQMMIAVEICGVHLERRDPRRELQRFVTEVPLAVPEMQSDRAVRAVEKTRGDEIGMSVFVDIGAQDRRGAFPGGQLAEEAEVAVAVAFEQGHAPRAREADARQIEMMIGIEIYRSDVARQAAANEIVPGGI